MVRSLGADQVIDYTREDDGGGFGLPDDGGATGVFGDDGGGFGLPDDGGATDPANQADVVGDQGGDGGVSDGMDA